MTDRARTRFQALVDLWRIQSDGTLDLERGRLLNRCADELSALLVQPVFTSDARTPEWKETAGNLSMRRMDAKKPCLCGVGEICLQPELLAGYVCVRAVGHQTLSALLVQEAPQEEEKTDDAIRDAFTRDAEAIIKDAT